MNTLYLAVPAWDLALDASGNIAIASEPYALAQDAASAIRTFLGEVWYDTTLGVPYLTQILGHSPPVELLKSLFVDAALTVPGIAQAQVFITSVSNRTVTGQVQCFDADGVFLSAASF